MMEMQETRRYILDILRDHGQATVDQMVAALDTRYGKNITAVTIRHHLGILQTEGLVTQPEMSRRNTPGRPRHIYMLTDKAQGSFPNNYPVLIGELLDQLQNRLSPGEVNVIFEGVADNMASAVIFPDVPWEEKLDLIVSYLNQQGYKASWENGTETGEYLLHTHNCPYHHLVRTSDSLCSMDFRLVSSLVGSVPRRMTRISSGDQACTYMISITEQAGVSS